ncbi:hypothetical protein QR97_24745 [Streptomyces sp. PBH53]|nr:hypothetical protein QR97_24745 [Streptomyces sp. PBH53]
MLARQVAEVRSTAEQRLYATVAKTARRADGSLPADLVALLDVPEGRRVSEPERLRRPPTRTTGTGMAKALERVDEIRALYWYSPPSTVTIEAPRWSVGREMNHETAAPSRPGSSRARSDTAVHWPARSLGPLPTTPLVAV